jgi:LPS-assembly protein
MIYLLFFLSCFLFPVKTVSAEESADITARHMEHISKTNIYIAKGSVKIVLGTTTLLADEIRLDGNTSDVIASGNVVYEDPEAIIKADRIELNFKTKLGTMYNGYIFYKENNIHLRTENIKKIEERTFFLDKATITSCDSDPPEWRITGKSITASQGESLKGKHATLRIGSIPVLYSPYFWAPLSKERETGFLFPLFGYSSTRGQYFKQGFFWAIRENQDASFYVDYYDEMGFAEGLDYRYVISPGSNGELWMYHVTDSEPSRSLFEIKAYHNQRLSDDISGYLKIHAVNEHDYYETMDSTSAGRFGLSSWGADPFGFASEERLQKYLESNLHISKSLSGGRTYILAQGRQSLEGSSKGIPQSLPEIGFILNTRSRKYFSFNMAVKGTNFMREEGQKGQRLDIFPNLYFSYGRLINITQRIGVRDTLYTLKKPAEDKNRLLFDLGTSLTTKFFKKYQTFIHLVEPSLEYEYVPSVNQDNISFFDSADFIPQTSRINYSLTNRISGLSSSTLETRLRLSQSYSFLDIDNQFSPVLAEAAVSSKRVVLNANASYDVHDNRFSETISSVTLKHDKGYVGAAKNYRRSSSLDQVIFKAGLHMPIKFFKTDLPVDFHGKLWYDLDGGGIQELNLRSSYEHQCWNLTLLFIKKPSDYQILFSVGLTSLGNLQLVSVR